MEDKAISEALGLESDFGYHVEEPPRPLLVGMVRERPLAPWYPCIDHDNTYHGCLGAACPLEVCWTGGQTVSYVEALRTRFQPRDVEYVPKALCGRCGHARETSVPVINQQQGLIHLTLRRCEEDRWEHPISEAALARNRIPAQAHVDPARCHLFEPAPTLIAGVERHRKRVNEQARARRAALAREGTDG
ncbi:MAG TPA: hypothetical protein VIJ28_14275 [Chloroflexota bacterium]|jgi:hypothetical protein